MKNNIVDLGWAYYGSSMEKQLNNKVKGVIPAVDLPCLNTVNLLLAYNLAILQFSIWQLC